MVNVPWSNTTFTTSDLDGTGVISGSQQVTFSGISGKPSGLVSQSATNFRWYWYSKWFCVKRFKRNWCN